VDCFGSFKTETYLPTSDIDLVVMGKLNALPFHQLQRKFIELGICLPTEIRVLDRASVPIIKLTDHSTQVRINISFNLPNVLKSVELIKV
jgi:non-canonical poly(A) RNA polymerase PAPD5/7